MNWLKRLIPSIKLSMSERENDYCVLMDVELDYHSGKASWKQYADALKWYKDKWMICGHSRNSAVSSKDGTCYCAECEYEAWR